MLKGLAHQLHFSSRHEREGVPVPLVMDDAVVEPDGPIGGDQMIRERALPTRRDVKLLGPLLQMHLGGCSVPTPDVDRGVAGQVGQEVTLAELVDPLLNWNNLKGAKCLRSLELLHIQCAQACVVKSPGNNSKGVAHKDLVYPVAREQVRG